MNAHELENEIRQVEKQQGNIMKQSLKAEIERVEEKFREIRKQAYVSYTEKTKLLDHIDALEALIKFYE